MNPNLYFIPLLLRAYEAPDRKLAFQSAFETIKRLGCQEEYARGYSQFLRFMDVVRNAYLSRRVESGLDVNKIDDGSRSIEELLEEDEDGDFRTYLRNALAAEKHDAYPIAPVHIVFRRGAISVREFEITENFPQATIEPLAVGKYVLALSTGQILWEQDLEAKHLLLAYSFPSEPMTFAADSCARAARPTIDTTVLDGSLAIRVFPGQRFGRMEVTLCSTLA